MGMNINKQTIIIGGGIVGATLAIKLAKAKMPVTLIDARPKMLEQDWKIKLTNRDARVYALSPASINLLKEADAWEHICKSGRKADYTQMHVWQPNGVGELKFADEYDSKLLGSMVEPFVIDYALFLAMQKEAIKDYLTVIAGKKVTKLDWRGDAVGYQVTLEDDKNEQKLYAKLVVGADGRNSFVRTQAGIKLDTLDYKQTAICCAIKTQKPHKATARQVMLPTGTLALLPLADITDEGRIDPQHWQSVVWTLPTYDALSLLTKDEAYIANELAFATGYELGNIEKIESIASFPLNAQQAKTYISNNLVLVGDAAHGVHPLAGQGLNLGMLDVAALFNVLMDDYKRSGNKQWGLLQTLKKYERQRRANNSIMMHGFSAINWIFTGYHTQLAPMQHLRSEAVSMVSKNKILMNWFNKQASGL